jgi:hypothetical protein
MLWKRALRWRLKSARSVLISNCESLITGYDPGGSNPPIAGEPRVAAEWQPSVRWLA